MVTIATFYICIKKLSAKTETKDKIMVIISVPLEHNEEYQLFRVIPIPTHRKEGEYLIIKTRTDYLAASLDRNSFYKISQLNLSNCQKVDQSFLCQQKLHGNL